MIRNERKEGGVFSFPRNFGMHIARMPETLEGGGDQKEGTKKSLPA